MPNRLSFAIYLPSSINPFAVSLLKFMRLMFHEVTSSLLAQMHTFCGKEEIIYKVVKGIEGFFYREL
jgi:hypothetical protein